MEQLGAASAKRDFLNQNNITNIFTLRLTNSLSYVSIFLEKRGDIEYYYYWENFGYWVLLDTENIKPFLPLEKLKKSLINRTVERYDLIKGSKLIMTSEEKINIHHKVKSFRNTSQIENLYQKILSVRSELKFSKDYMYYFDSIFDNIFKNTLKDFEVNFTFQGISLIATDAFMGCEWADFKKVLRMLVKKEILRYELLNNQKRHINIQFNRKLFAIEQDLEPLFFNYLFYKPIYEPEISEKITIDSFNNKNSENQEVVEYFDDYDEDISEFPEGEDIEKKHKSKERNPKLIAKAKENFKKKHGKLFCQVCTFDFCKEYGKLGEDYIEGHHTLPVSEMKKSHRSLVKDIALVCANCHRMLHRRRPWLSIDDLKNVLSKNTI